MNVLLRMVLYSNLSLVQYFHGSNLRFRWDGSKVMMPPEREEKRNNDDMLPNQSEEEEDLVKKACQEIQHQFVEEDQEEEGEVV